MRYLGRTNRFQRGCRFVLEKATFCPSSSPERLIVQSSFKAICLGNPVLVGFSGNAPSPRKISPASPSVPMTPMLTQYLEIKKRHPDALLFYRMGDFYEMFFDDAVKAAPMLEVQLTSRDRNSPNPIPMCGVPYHAVSGYLQKLLARGMKVAICEQMEDPSAVKGLVRRDVVRVVTPALIGDPELVATDVCNILVCLHEAENEEIEVCLLDLLRGQIRLGTTPSRHQLMDLFWRALSQGSPR